jgi:hypothetical protein
VRRPGKALLRQSQRLVLTPSGQGLVLPQGVLLLLLLALLVLVLLQVVLVAQHQPVWRCAARQQGVCLQAAAQ